MANSNTVTITITTDASGAVTGIQQATDAQENHKKKTVSNIEAINAAWNSAAVKIAAYTYVVEQAGAMVEKVFRQAEQGARVMQVEQSFKTITQSVGLFEKTTIEAMQRATAHTIDESDMMQKAVKSIGQGLDTLQEQVQLSEIARIAAQRQGVDVKEAYERISDSIANELPRGMRQFGLVTKEQFSLLNQAVSLGIENVNLLSIAWTNAKIAELQMTTGTDTASEKMQQLKAKFQEANEIVQKLYANTVLWLAKLAEETSTPSFEKELKRRAGLAGIEDAPASKDALELSRLADLNYFEGRRDRETADMKAANAAEKNKKKVEELQRAFEAFATSVANSNPLLDEHTRKLNEIENAAKKLISEGYDKQKVKEQEAIAKANLELARSIEIIRKVQEGEAKLYEQRTATANKIKEINEKYEIAGLTNVISLEQKRIELAAKSGNITDVAAVEARYALTQKVLDAEREQVSNMSIRARTEEEEIKVYEAHLTVKEKINQADRQRVYDIGAAELTQQQKLLDLERERFDKENTARTNVQNMSMAAGGETGALGTGLSMFQQGATGLLNVAQKKDPYSLDLERARMYWEQKNNLWQQGQATMAQVEDAGHTYLLALDQQTNAMRLQNAQYMTTSMLGIFSMLYQASGEQSQALFYLMKAAAVAQAVVNAWLAYTYALAAPGLPGEREIYANAVLAIGLAAAATIAATAFMGPSAGAGVAGSATGGTPSLVQTTPAGTVAPTDTTKPERPMVINIHFGGYVQDKDSFAREIIPSIRKAVEDGMSI